MNFAVQHVHLKTRDPKQTAQFYVDNFGATLKDEIPGRGFRVDLHGLQLNITGLIAVQNHEQHYGIEHMAVQTDDYAGTLARLQKNGWRSCHPTMVGTSASWSAPTARRWRSSKRRSHARASHLSAQVVISASSSFPRKREPRRANSGACSPGSPYSRG